MTRRALLLLAILLFPTSCSAHIRVRPVSTPSVAILCEFPRRYFIAEGTVTQAESEALQAAIVATNELTPGLVVFAGIVPVDQVRAHLAAGGTVMIGAPDRYDVLDRAAVEAVNGTLAYTGMKSDPQTGCLAGVPIVILADLESFPAGYSADSVIWHEFMHSLGFGHADPGGAFKTIMRPSIGANGPANFSAADKRSILSVYSRGVF